MASPLTLQIKKQHNKVKVIVIASNKTAHVFQGSPCVDELVVFHPEKSTVLAFCKLFFHLRNFDIDVLLATQPSNTVSQSLITALSGAKYALKHAKDYSNDRFRDYSFLYNRTVSDDRMRHRVELNLDLLRVIGLTIPDGIASPQFFVSKDVQLKIDNWIARQGLNKHKIVAIHPGGLRANKHWPIERYIKVANVLLDNGCMIILVGGKNEEYQCLKIQQDLGKRLLFNVAGKLALAETAALLKRCACLISNDTGVMHIASAVDIPIIAIFGPTDPEHIGPYSSHAIALKKGYDVNLISVDDVLHAFNNISLSFDNPQLPK